MCQSSTARKCVTKPEYHQEDIHKLSLTNNDTSVNMGEVCLPNQKSFSEEKPNQNAFRQIENSSINDLSFKSKNYKIQLEFTGTSSLDIAEEIRTYLKEKYIKEKIWSMQSEAVAVQSPSQKKKKESREP